jgi:hypothetical protein
VGIRADPWFAESRELTAESRWLICGMDTSTTPPASRRFCAACGASFPDGANFCHRCGTPVGSAAMPAGGAAAAAAAAAAPRGAGTVLPWAVAFVALLALAAMAAGRNFNAKGGSTLDAPLNALPQAALGEAGGAGPASAPGAGGGMGARGVDLASMSPREQANRLFERVSRLASQGKVDSVAFFAPMALGVYESLDAITIDERYHMGRIAEMAGAREVARAQADTILRENPTHLLGLILGAKAAAMVPDEAAFRAFERRLVAAEARERAAALPEYRDHQQEIDLALTDARTRK